MTRAATRLRIAVLLAAASALSGCRGGAGRRLGRGGYRSAARYGVRAGAARFGGFELKEQDDRPLVGLYLRLSDPGPFLFELGVDAAADSEEPGDRQLFAGRVDVFAYPLRKERWYLHAGGGVLYEQLPVNSYTAGFASAGTGWAFPVGGAELDVRVSYWKFIESENAQDAVLVTLGLGF